MKYSLVVDCLKWSCPAGATAKNLGFTRKVRLIVRLCLAFSVYGSNPRARTIEAQPSECLGFSIYGSNPNVGTIEAQVEMGFETYLVLLPTLRRPTMST